MNTRHKCPLPADTHNHRQLSHLEPVYKFRLKLNCSFFRQMNQIRKNVVEKICWSLINWWLIHLGVTKASPRFNNKWLCVSVCTWVRSTFLSIVVTTTCTGVKNCHNLWVICKKDGIKLVNLQFNFIWFGKCTCYCILGGRNWIPWFIINHQNFNFDQSSGKQVH